MSINHTDVFINKSSKSYPVKSARNKTQIGSIVNNEVFGAADPRFYDLSPGDTGPGCVFRNSSGQVVKDSSAYISIGNVIPSGLFTPLSNYPYSNVVINGTTYKTYKARRNTTIYRPGGSIWGTVAANCLVALAIGDYQTTFSGESNMDYIAIAYVQSTSGNWVKASGDGLNHCFAPIGLEYGSGTSYINFIGRF